jgi:CRP/FNR family transcriptional regulator, anaerobic regulatory protein
MKEHFIKYLQEKASLREEHIPIIEEMVSAKEIKKGQFLLKAGQICRHAFFIEKGLVRLYSIDEQGKEHIVQFASENWFVSDRESLFFGKPSGFFIDALEHTELLLLDQDFIKKVTEISAEFRNYNEFLLQNHIRHLQNRIVMLISESAEKRYLNFIDIYPDLTLRVPQWMMASYLGITPESLSRVRKDLASRNFNQD